MRKNNVHVRTEWLLKNVPELRDSDKKLLMTYWEKEGLLLTETQKQIFLDKCTTAESITRARRALKEDYPSSKSVAEERYKKSQEFRHRYSDPVIIF